MRKKSTIVTLAFVVMVSAVFQTSVFAAGMDIIFDGSLSLSPDAVFEVRAHNPGGETYAVKEATPLGALQVIVSQKGLTYDVTDKNYGESGALLLDNIGSYKYAKGGSRWYAYVNGQFKDGFKNPEGALNLIQLKDGDVVEYYFASGVADAEDFGAVKAKATASVKALISLGASFMDEESEKSGEDAETSAEEDWSLTLKGKITEVLSRETFEEGVACARAGHYAEWTDKDGNVWSGMPLWLLAGWVDDNVPHGYNFPQAEAGYTILVKAEDGYTKEFSSRVVGKSNDYIIADKLNGESLTTAWPLRLVGDGVAKADGTLSSSAVGNVVLIELVNFGETLPLPELRIIKYGADQVTVVEEMTVNHEWLEENLPVIGDGETVYRYEGITNDPDDVWGRNATYPGGFKLENAIKGTRVRDICDLVGGMGSGTEIVFVAKDGYETVLPYSSIYPDPAVYSRQGEAILAWWGDGHYVPDYKDGMRLFFTPEDLVYSQWDMHESLPEKYWHYYYSGLVQYPSAAGLSPKYINEIRIYTLPSGDWTLSLDGKDIGGLHEDINKTYFEQALVCQFGANHKATYTDNKGRVWEGMPLWFLAGFVDDEDKHTSDAFNVDLAEEGYTIVLTAGDGHNVSIDSRDIVKNNDYIVANSVDGGVIPESDRNWPLRLVGPSVSGSSSVGNIVSMALVKSEGLTDIFGHWAKDSIEQLVKLGVVNGYPDGTFKPDADITRAEFVTLLIKALKPRTDESLEFSDILGHWAEEYIRTAASAGIVEGYDGNLFRPDDPVTREQMATMAIRALDLELVDEETSFIDEENISAWAKPSVATAVGVGIVKGYPDDTFRPQVKATRAEAVTIIVNLLGQ